MVKMIPFGGPAPSFGISAKIRQKKLRLLYVGSLTQRKGLSYLFQAVDQLGECAELTVVGAKPLGQCRSLDVALARHHWIPSLPHYKILEVMRDHDVFVFPSLFEGFALVILEAMSQGLPVITTPNSGTADIVDDGVDGFIVPIRSSEAVADRLKMLLDRDRLAAMGDEALKKAAKYSWERYRHCVKMFIMEVLR
jgi:glycosyltransferase involved in cell wall biosynthesis